MKTRVTKRERKIKVVGIGAGGHARCVMDVLRGRQDIEIYGLLDSNSALAGQVVDGVPVLGDDSMMSELLEHGICNVFIGVGGISDLSRRRNLYNKAREMGFTVLSCIHSSACISVSAVLGAGITVMAGAIINAGVSIGDNVLVNTGGIVEHDCVVGSHAHIATRATLTGGVSVGELSMIGAGATVRQYIKIGRQAIVAAGAVVVKDVMDGMVVAGVPAQPMRSGVKHDISCR